MRVEHAAIAIVAACCACELPLPVYAPDPIPLTEAGTGGGLLGMGTAADVTTPFPMLVDTATPVTSYSTGDQPVSASRGTVRLYADDGSTASQVPRLELDDVQIFTAPLSPSGLDAPTPIGGVLGGDNLSSFVVDVSYTPSPSLQLSNDLILSDCEVGDRCGSVLPFTPAGGHQLIDIGEAIYSYPASYVLLDACVEPLPDPLESKTVCEDAGCLSVCGTSSDPTACATACDGHTRGCDDLCEKTPTATACVACLTAAARYVSSGTDIRFVIATGFPGVALTASAYDRLRGSGAAEALLAGTTQALYLPSQSGAVQVAPTTLGSQAAGAERSALVFVGHREYFGACDEMARSRRLRRVPVTGDQAAYDPECLRYPGRFQYPQARTSTSGKVTWPLEDDPLLTTCEQTNGSGGVCDDRSGDSHTTAYVELEDTLPIFIVPDTFSLLQGINADVRTDSSTVEGVIGTEYLRRFGTTIDYPGDRVVMTCVDPSCRSFPQSNHGTDCATPAASLFYEGGPARLIAGAGCAPPLAASRR